MLPQTSQCSPGPHKVCMRHQKYSALILAVEMKRLSFLNLTSTRSACAHQGSEIWTCLKLLHLLSCNLLLDRIPHCLTYGLTPSNSQSILCPLTNPTPLLKMTIKAPDIPETTRSSPPVSVHNKGASSAPIRALKHRDAQEESSRLKDHSATHRSASDLMSLCYNPLCNCWTNQTT